MDSRFRFLHHTELFDEAVTQKDRISAVMVSCAGTSRLSGSQVHRSEGVPVPQTDAGGREENSETDGRTLVKELGKMTP